MNRIKNFSPYISIFLCILLVINILVIINQSTKIEMLKFELQNQISDNKYYRSMIQKLQEREGNLEGKLYNLKNKSSPVV